MKNERVRICKASLAMVYCHTMAMLDRIVTMDQSAMSFHKIQTKQQSGQWLVKGPPGLTKAKVLTTKANVHASRTKQMVLAFFNSKGLIYTNVPRDPW